MTQAPCIVELDFGMGNIRSLQKAFESFDQPVEVINNPGKIASADAVIIPGDGAFGKAMENIKSIGFYDEVRKFISTGKPVLGICIGFQILFESSEEFNYDKSGFSIFPGKVEKFKTQKYNIPHMGWNNIEFTSDSRLFKDIKNNSYFYFVHSFCVPGKHENATGVCDYDGIFTGIVEKDNVFGVQFHPEKSHNNGIQMLKNFVDVVKCN